MESVESGENGKMTEMVRSKQGRVRTMISVIVVAMVILVASRGTEWKSNSENKELLMKKVAKDNAVLEGALIRPSNNPAVFQIFGGRKHWIPNPHTYNNLYVSWNRINVVHPHVSNSIPTGAQYSSGARLIRCGHFAHIFLHTNGQKRWICNPSTYNKYSFSWGKVHHLSVAACQGICNGPIICNNLFSAVAQPYYGQLHHMGGTCTGTPSAGTLLKCGSAPVYQMMDGKKRWIPNPATLNNLYSHSGWAKVLTYPSNFCGTVATGPQFTSGARMIRCHGYPHIFLESNGQKRWVCDPATYNAYFFSWHTVHAVSVQQCKNICTGPTICLTSASATRQPYYGQLQQVLSLRVRKDWTQLSDVEKTRYLTGYKQLRANGKLEEFTKEHIEAAGALFDGLRFHGNSGFLPWHRYFIWELEQQIRALGGEYTCFTLPFWDWTRGTGLTVENNPLWDTIIGGNGDSGNSGCVAAGLMSSSSGYTMSTVNGGGCLTRSFRPGSFWYQTEAQILAAVEQTQVYTSFRSYWEGQHNSAHVSVCGALCGTSTAPDDPVFYMLHNFVDMVWALRSDCHNYNQATSNTDDIFPNSEINIEMSYPELAKNSWALASQKNITVSDLLKTSSWGYTFDASNMIQRSGMSMSGCTWNEIISASQEKWVAEPTRVGHVGHLVSWDVARLRAGVSGTVSDPDIAKFACKRMQELSVKHGYASGVCKYTESLEKCGPGGKLDISLHDILNRRGVRGNSCIIKMREAVYAFAKQTGTLRGLCNGMEDPVCPV